MYLHLGGKVIVCNQDIVGIFDLENTSVSKDTKAYLARVQKEGRVENVSMEMPKSFLITGKKDEEKVFITQMSPATLRRRNEANDASSHGGNSICGAGFGRIFSELPDGNVSQKEKR